jgi:hypothetical protein
MGEPQAFAEFSPISVRFFRIWGETSVAARDRGSFFSMLRSYQLLGRVVESPMVYNQVA